MTFKQFLSISEDMTAMTTTNPAAARMQAQQQFNQELGTQPDGTPPRKMVSGAAKKLAQKNAPAVDTLFNQDNQQPNAPKMMRKMKK